MNYDNIIYPLDRIYSSATGVTYPVCGAGHDTPDPKSVYFHITNISEETGEFSIGNYTSGTMEYSLDGENWNDYNLTTKPSVSVNAGGEIYLRGTNFKNDTLQVGPVIKFTKNYTVGGNYMSLSNYETMESVTKIDDTNCIKYTFRSQTNLVSAADLNFGNVTKIDFYSLQSAFDNCQSLTSAPYMSQITSIGMYGLNSAFSNCNSLTSGPDFSNVTSVGDRGLQGIFFNCLKISSVTAPNISDLTQNNVLAQWLINAGSQVTGTKTVRVPTGATIATDSESGIPTGWVRVDY